MRPVVLYTLLSLDGVAESPDQFVFDWDDRLDANLADVIAEQDAVLLGHQMYDEWAEYWPTSDVEPFASFINGVQKYVVASSDPEGDWGPRTLVTEGLESFVAELKTTRRRSHRHPRQHPVGPVAAARRPGRRTPAGYRSGDRGVRTPTVRGR